MAKEVRCCGKITRIMNDPERLTTVVELVTDGGEYPYKKNNPRFVFYPEQMKGFYNGDLVEIVGSVIPAGIGFYLQGENICKARRKICDYIDFRRIENPESGNISDKNVVLVSGKIEEIKPKKNGFIVVVNKIPIDIPEIKVPKVEEFMELGKNVFILAHIATGQIKRQQMANWQKLMLIDIQEQSEFFLKTKTEDTESVEVASKETSKPFVDVNRLKLSGVIRKIIITNTRTYLTLETRFFFGRKNESKTIISDVMFYFPLSMPKVQLNDSVEIIGYLQTSKRDETGFSHLEIIGEHLQLKTCPLAKYVSPKFLKNPFQHKQNEENVVVVSGHIIKAIQRKTNYGSVVICNLRYVGKNGIKKTVSFSAFNREANFLLNCEPNEHIVVVGRIQQTSNIDNANLRLKSLRLCATDIAIVKE